MEILKSLQEPAELKLLKLLQPRTSLAELDEKYCKNLIKGFEGEQFFEQILKEISMDAIILTDLLLQFINTLFQIDLVIITKEVIYLFEVKNYEGDYILEDDKWLSLSGNEISNPFLQLKRSESLFRRIVQSLNHSFKVEGFLILVNPEFYLYNSPVNKSIIFPTQMNRFIQKLQKIPTYITPKQRDFATKLQSIILSESPYTRLPQYNFKDLMKGIPCPVCGSFMHIGGKLIIKCQNCSNQESVDTAVLRMVKEFNLLFPDLSITTRLIYDWCGEILSKKQIRRVLSREFKVIGKRNTTYYVVKGDETH